MAPSNIQAFEKSSFFSEEAKKRILSERELDPLTQGGDETLESFVLRRFGSELLEKLHVIFWKVTVTVGQAAIFVQRQIQPVIELGFQQ